MTPEINLFQVPYTGPKKRVLFVITQSEFGGAQRFLFELLKGIPRERYEFLIATGSDGDDGFSYSVNELGFQHHTILSLKRNPNLISDLKAVWEIKDLIQTWKPDTLFLNSSKAGFIGALASRLTGLRQRVIYRIGGWTFNDPWPTWKKKIWIELEKISARWKDYIIVNNSHDLSQAKELGIKPRQEVVLIHNGIDPHKIPFLSAQDARKALITILAKTPHFTHTKHIIGTIANFYPPKGLRYLINAASLLKNLDTIFVIIGDGAGRPELEKQITELGLAKKIFLVGRLAHASQYLPGLDVFVLPSVKEGFAWSILEAMSAKVPVIATSVGAAPEMIESGINGYLIPPRQPEAITEKISQMLSDSRRTSELALRAHQTVLLKFSLEQMIHKIEKLL